MAQAACLRALQWASRWLQSSSLPCWSWWSSPSGAGLGGNDAAVHRRPQQPLQQELQVPRGLQALQALRHRHRSHGGRAPRKQLALQLALQLAQALQSSQRAPCPPPVPWPCPAPRTLRL